MPQTNRVHIDSFLTDVASGYTNAAFIADEFAPVIPVTKESGKIGVYGDAHYRVGDVQPRQPGGNTSQWDWQAAAELSFAADEWSMEVPVDVRHEALYDEPFDARRDATDLVMHLVKTKQEDVIGGFASTGGNFGGTTAAGTVWSTAASATPVTNIRSAIAAIVSRTGASEGDIWAAMSFELWQEMIQTTEFKALYLNTIPGAAAPGTITKAQAAAAIGLAGILVGNSVKITSNEGASVTRAYIWGTSTVAVFVRSARPTLMNPGFAAILAPTVEGMPRGASVAIDEYWNPSRKSTMVRATAFFDILAVTSALGQQITGA